MCKAENIFFIYRFYFFLIVYFSIVNFLNFVFLNILFEFEKKKQNFEKEKRKSKKLNQLINPLYLDSLCVLVKSEKEKMRILEMRKDGNLNKTDLPQGTIRRREIQTFFVFFVIRRILHHNHYWKMSGRSFGRFLMTQILWLLRNSFRLDFVLRILSVSIETRFETSDEGGGNYLE